jgi:phosphoglucomutase/phosphomannomutase
MVDIDTFISLIKDGFINLSISEKYKEAALQNIKLWLTDSMFQEYVPQIQYWVESKKWDKLLNSFYQVLPFGTGGRRGSVGIGPNRINGWTIQSSAQGHSRYLINKFGEEAKKRGIVLTYDVRKYTQKGVYNDKISNPVQNLDGERLSHLAAQVYAANGIQVYLYRAPRSTPQLSFSIRYLHAISGAMFSASHNLPTDNGKKVYDEFGGQLIPPLDQMLVDEVTQNVKEINTIPFEQACEQNLITFLDESIDNAYHDAVCKLSCSSERDIHILYSALHGTGMSSVYPILQKAGFKVTLDSKTSNLSGDFENVTFRIPNPEVQESFQTALEEANKVNADIILSTDPDADRIGIMVRHNEKWQFINGNEIGIILTQYGILQRKEKGTLNLNSTVIKTEVTNSLIEKIAHKNNVRCIGNLLVGFKYIGNIMNQLEQEGKMDDFILGTEESHGFLIGNYARDKDAAGAAIWLAELAAVLKKQDKTLIDYLNEIYVEYGYCHNYLTEIRLTGVQGMDQIAKIMQTLRTEPIESIDHFILQKKYDRWQGTPHLSPTDTASRNVIVLHMEPTDIVSSCRIIARPSGTEPKLKFYIEMIGTPCTMKTLEEQKQILIEQRTTLEHILMIYSYGILGIEFPKRGFLLFWQLPLNDKLHYFEIEDNIVELAKIEDKEERRTKLNELLTFLGANPIEKVNRAFQAKYQKGIIEYLNL